MPRRDTLLGVWFLYERLLATLPRVVLGTCSSCRMRRSSQSLKSSGTERTRMKASVVGSGYVGTTLAACLADLGHDVVAVDIDEETVARLDAGETPHPRA